MTAIDNATLSHVTSRDGTEIAYFTSGEGPPLVLVHGGLGDHTRWAALRPYLEPHVTVHAMDRRGRGASGDHPAYAMAREVEDVAAVVDAVAAVSGCEVAVLGSSLGASLALAAASLTSHIGRLVLFEPPTGAVVNAMPGGLRDRMEALYDAGDREELLATAYRVIVGLSDAQIDALRAQPEWPNRVAAAHTIPRELVPQDALFDPDQAAGVAVPALLLVGGATPEHFKVSAGEVAAALQDARLIVLEGQGHGAELFAPDVVAEALLEFLLGS